MDSPRQSVEQCIKFTPSGGSVEVAVYREDGTVRFDVSDAGIGIAAAEIDRLLRREGMKVAVTDGEGADALETTPGALGTSTLALIISEKRSLKALALDGVAPGAKTIADRTYPHLKSFYALTGIKPTGPAEDFMSFLRSPTAHEILTKLGFWTDEGTL